MGPFFSFGGGVRVTSASDPIGFFRRLKLSRFFNFGRRNPLCGVVSHACAKPNLLTSCSWSVRYTVTGASGSNTLVKRGVCHNTVVTSPLPHPYSARKMPLIDIFYGDPLIAGGGIAKQKTGPKKYQHQALFNSV